MLKATILYPYNEHIERLFAPELKEFPRATYSVVRDGSDIRFTITATDATALRAVTTTITKVLSVWESAQEHGR